MSQLPVFQGSGPGPSRPGKPPIFNLPPGVKWLILVLVCVHIAQQIMPYWLNIRLEKTFGYIPLRFWLVLHGQWGGPGFEIVATPLTYLFLHGSWLHLGVNILSLAAFGTAVENIAGARFMTWLFMICGVMGAFTEFAVEPRSPEIIIGASAGISGLFAVAFLSMAERQRMSRFKLISVTALVVGIIVVMGIGGVPGSAMPVAWIAHVGGFLSGVVASRCITRSPGCRTGHDIGWFVAIMALPMFVLLLNVARHR
jgi:membrane associated rhomboid family serine protease